MKSVTTFFSLTSVSSVILPSLAMLLKSAASLVLRERKQDKLDANELLERCQTGFTQNNNNSFNLLVWKFTPRIMTSSATIEQIAQLMTRQGAVKIMRTMGIKVVNIAEKTPNGASV
ncbi:hypothetical protein J437_LFUL014558 [Ladona fulva]|uniref:Uncharacterized protein n=1 Tax=Ladona fulva TaxID=123851 RepID=A0A8K0P400_LADFU|nr:hypothetical protein J437_LFUL014558 [Ladona fulva]